MIKMLTTLLLTTFLISCVDCWTVKPQVSCDVSFQFDRCRCRCLDLQNLETIHQKNCDLDWPEPVRDFPLLQCEGIAGFYLDDITKKIKPQAKETKDCYEDKCE